MNKYIKVFSTDADYQSFISGEIDKPNLSYVKATNEVHYNPFIDYSKEYLTFEALESGTFTLTVPSAVNSTYMTSISYSVDDGDNWVTTTIDNTAQTITTPTIAQGDTVLWKGEGSTLYKGALDGNWSFFSSTGNFNVHGNMMSLLYGDNFANQTTFPSNSSGNFGKLFNSCTKLMNVENLVLTATTLSANCYYSMFNGCTALTTAPALPATTLAEYCYQYMFNGCTALTTAPALPATTLEQYCYQYMFSGCTALTTVPALPATTMKLNCYNNMFSGCTALTTVPSNLLTSTTLALNCYQAMFSGCTALTTAPELPATTIALFCYDNMFSGCTALTTAPELPATSLKMNCYQAMFSGCRNLNSITMLATDISASGCLNNWVSNVAATGTFTKDASMTTLPTGNNGIPSGWTVVDA